jgi:hypothetical protein
VGVGHPAAPITPVESAMANTFRVVRKIDHGESGAGTTWWRLLLWVAEWTSRDLLDDSTPRHFTAPANSWQLVLPRDSVERYCSGMNHQLDFCHLAR